MKKRLTIEEREQILKALETEQKIIATARIMAYHSAKLDGKTETESHMYAGQYHDEYREEASIYLAVDDL